jgi:histidinol-phosphate aminotransferase
MSVGVALWLLYCCHEIGSGDPDHRSILKRNQRRRGQASDRRLLPVTGLVAGTASLRVPTLVASRRKANADTRESVFNFLEQKKFSYVPSTTNFFMLEVKRPGKEAAAAMMKEKVLIGRTWPAWPTRVRITIGSPDDMKRFQAALLKVMA